MSPMNNTHDDSRFEGVLQSTPDPSDRARVGLPKIPVDSEDPCPHIPVAAGVVDDIRTHIQ